MSIVLQFTPDTYQFIDFFFRQTLLGGNELFARFGDFFGGLFGQFLGMPGACPVGSPFCRI